MAKKDVSESIASFLALVPSLDDGRCSISPWHGYRGTRLIDDDGIGVGFKNCFNKSILASVFGEVHCLTIVAFRFPFGVKSNTDNSHVGFACNRDGFLKEVYLRLFFVADSATTICVSGTFERHLRSWSDLICALN